MHSSIPSEKISRNSRTIGRDWHPKVNDTRPDNSKPRKRDYTQQRKLKEKFLVFSS